MSIKGLYVKGFNIMVTFFPSPYPDELLYSVFARYHTRTLNPSFKWTTEDLFSKRTVRAVVDLPSNLNNFSNNVSTFGNIDPEELINHHTMLPYYSAFIDKERYKKVIYAMKEDLGGTIHTRMGIAASNIPMNEYFYHCKKCYSESMEQFGEAYWMRIHQAPGVYYCPLHEEVLFQSDMSFKQINQHHYIRAKDSIITFLKPKLENINENVERVLVKLAKDINWLLNQNIEPANTDFFRAYYQTALKEKGIVNLNGRVDRNRLKRDFLDYYPEGLLEILHSNFDILDEQPWVVLMLQKHRKSFHPIRHWLLIHFLGFDFYNVFTEKVDYMPFGSGPWYCLNPVCDNFNRQVVTDFKQSYCKDAKKPRGIFTCTCGYSYTRLGPDLTYEDNFKKTRVLNYGSVWEKELVKLSKSNQTLVSMSNMLGIDRTTLKKKLISLEKTDRTEACDNEEDLNVSLRLKQSKEEWLLLQSNNPNLGKTGLRQLAPKLYTSIYRKDKEWLNKNSPLRMKNNSINTQRVDWQKRDDEVLRKVKSAYQHLIQQEPPVRITLGTLSRLLDVKYVNLKYLEKMPMSNHYLSQVNESVVEFQKRRVQSVVKRLMSNKLLVKEWEVYRLAGLKNNVEVEVKRFITNAVNKANNVNEKHKSILD